MKILYIFILTFLFINKSSLANVDDPFTRSLGEGGVVAEQTTDQEVVTEQVENTNSE